MSDSGTDGGLRERVTALLAELGLDEPLTGVTDLSASLGVVQGVLPERVVDLAVTESGRRRLRAELRGRRWAEERQVGVPEVLAAADDGRWLLSRRVHALPAGGPRWTEAAVDAAVRIAPLPAPPGAPWQSPARPALRRARASVGGTGRLVRGGVRLGELRAVRAAAAQLPRSEVTHGDLRAANAVLDADGHLVVLEWTGVRPGPRHRDLLTLWATTAAEEDRAQIARVVLDRTAGWEEPDVGLLWHAIALEQLVERLTRPGHANGLDPAFARARLADARGIAAELGSPVR
ncbi:phosphotransferase [Geodermatophilus ruber]|uniref:Aminoglycoside phosphotransferase n=1 Tax=Geodermatophilus ruber TaxID=504800 RepID=A0A1I4LVP2_9ACTN|nr:phosphotransferase [Geodermatophilus ruber]SFL94994.1 Aminoglycoside phosphotransferase [Geodermatophilus ruber]